MKDKRWLWQLATNAYQEKEQSQSRLFLRLMAFVWAAGIRPTPDQLRQEIVDFFEKSAFLLVVHRGLRGEELTTGGNRLSLFTFRKWDIERYITTNYPKLIAKSIYKECLKHLCDADVTVYCAREEGSHSLVDKLMTYLQDYCLLPEDLGITAEDMSQWQHERWVSQAQHKFSVCRPLPQYGYDPQTIYLNIYGVLQALVQGVTLEEAGIKPGELLRVREELEKWLPQALKRPSDHGVSSEGVRSFRAEVMPMFDQVLDEESLFTE
ncbi:MAG TPA: hypothetical protein VD907_05670 [Verrucomicrobiae bacterium]|nr:hypothetical protein [Verrucomicrobiae bacterium]